MAEDVLVWSESDAKRIGRAVRKIESQKLPPRGGGKATSRADPFRFLARITGWLQFGGVMRWKYAWEQIILDVDADVPATPALTGTTSLRYALNLREINNVADHAGTQGNSINEQAAGFPAGFHVIPVGGGAGGAPANQVVVWMWIVGDKQRNARYVFEYENAENGSCP